MSSREAILAAIRQNKPESGSLPQIPPFPFSGDLVGKYQQALKANGGTSFVVEDIAEVKNYLTQQFDTGVKICSNISEIPGNFDFYAIKDPHVLEDVHVVVLKGEWAVAENAAIWLSEAALVQRVLPFITQHLIIVLDKSTLLKNMHEVYHKINIRNAGYGVFIAGPSKTADIEQSLVIGAHGARSLNVFLL